MIGLALPGVLLVASTDPVRLADALTIHWRVPPGSPTARWPRCGWRRSWPPSSSRPGWPGAPAGVEAGRNPVAHARLFAGIAFTLLVGAVRRGSRLATAMDARGFDSGVPRTNARGSVLRRRDAAFVVGSVRRLRGRGRRSASPPGLDADLRG